MFLQVLVIGRERGKGLIGKISSGLAFFEMPSQPTVCFQGFCVGRQKGSATVCDPNPPCPFARYGCTPENRCDYSAIVWRFSAISAVKLAILHLAIGTQRFFCDCIFWDAKLEKGTAAPRSSAKKVSWRRFRFFAYITLFSGTFWGVKMSRSRGRYEE